MATRRSRIQIKPNTGPRIGTRDTPADKTPATPTKPAPPSSPTKAAAPQTPTKSDPPTAAKPPAQTAASPAPQTIAKALPPAPAPPSPTKPIPPSPSKDPEPETVTTVVPEEPQSAPKQNTEEITAVEVFKKPEVSSKSSQPVKESTPLTQTQEVATTSSQALVVKKNYTRKKNSDGTRQTQRNLSAFKQTEPPDRTKMTIMDLIHWNPIQNPMKKSAEPVRTGSTESLVAETSTDKSSEETADKETEDFIPGPRVIVGEDGQITLDESSLVIEQTTPANDLSQEVVYETSDTTYSSYSKKIISRQFWTMKDTAMFYKALSVVGTDFALMAKFFPKRTRADLKRKFKKEERTRRDLLDKAVCEWHNFDLEDIQDFLFCKEKQQLDDQNEEEARVDNPDGPSENTRPNNYVRENLMSVLPKKRGRPQSQGNKKSKPDKENGTQVKKRDRKTNKRTSGRNLWSDEEAEPVGSADEIDLCDDNNEQDKMEDPHSESCDCCQIKTKTSERQKSLEAKKRRLQQLEEQRQVHLKYNRTPIRETSLSPTLESLTDTVSFTVLADKSTVTPRPAVGTVSPVFRTPSTPGDPFNVSSPIASTSTAVNGITPKTPNVGISFTVLTDKSALTPRSTVGEVSPVFRTPSTPSDASYTMTPKSPTNLTPTPSTSINGTTQKTPNVGIVLANKTASSINKGAGTVSPSKPVNVVNMNSSVASSPLLQALLNRVPPQTPGGSPSQFLLVADKTPNNEQVLHVYLVSPNPSQAAAQSSTTGNSMLVNSDTLRRLGIRPITQQQQPQPQKTPETSEK